MLTIRPAVSGDIPLMLALIRELAEYERSPESAVATEEDLMRHGFGAQPRFQCVIADWDGEPAGFALYFYNFSTWTGRAGIYLEDLFVRPVHRRKGIGKELFRYLAAKTQEEHLSRLVWQVLDWNQPAIDFYLSLGATPLADWQTMRLSGDALEALAQSK
ncbi:MAG TPA: GNAT family N-acetyltransferase [Bryobacteraceae bacterium]|jgi:GNAT superfamily N-acetyltransferase|nr:GNAT family N-acetyltransferase [Bryobacteraceae bacterium]